MTENCSLIERGARGELLLELLSEEIPAGMQGRAIAELVGLLRDKLSAAEVPAAELRGYVTPRRLTVIAKGIPSAQPDRSEERRGPRLGAPATAIEGFLRSAGIASIEECEVRDTGRGEFYFATVNRPGRPAAEVLPALVMSAAVELPWAKSMRYPASSLRWVRPLTSVVCLFEGEIVTLRLDRVPVGRTTRGHRFLSSGEICVGSAAEYLECLGKACVVVDQHSRKQAIRQDLEALAERESLTVKPDPGLLDEVTGLAEFPVVFAGAIDCQYMDLPPEVLATAMRTHQRYFSCLQSDGTPAPRFLFVADNIAADHGKTIIAGNERVLRARLADARFFWDQDRRIPLASRVEALSQRVFHAKLGSLYDKTLRMEHLAEFLADFVPGADRERARRAARLAKADLSTGMVGEFPELQGVMGRYYALHNGEHPAVADAIAEYYRPAGPNDQCPTAPLSVVAALADRIDSLVAFFAIGEKPTGSRDPFALRRAALGIIRLIVENSLRVPLAVAFQEARATLAPDFADPASELLDFIAERLRVHLRQQGIGHDLIAAVFERGGKREDDLVRLLARVAALRKFLGSEDGANLLTAFRRASNIVAIEERRDDRSYGGNIDPTLLQQPEERVLAECLTEVDERAGTFLRCERFETAMSELARLRRPVDDFFDKVTVNCDAPALRENRLRLLSCIRTTLNRVADFSRIEG
ncbi:MAG: glycine--tRNA ligase subunit beta [Alphaproteobacteria bacterium]|nr:glycine--tRNA ligase subunit beta [Alphaproteobacteria bacterium]